MNPATELDLETDTPERRLFFTDLVARVSSGDVSGIEDLYRLFSPGISFFLRRRLGTQNLDENLAKVFLTLTESIQHGDLAEPVRIVAFVRNVMRREIAGALQPDIHEAAPPSSKQDQQTLALASKILSGSSPRDCDVLVRFYVLKQLPARICADLGLSEPQFRPILSRAKAAFDELTKARAKKLAAGAASSALPARESLAAS